MLTTYYFKVVKIYTEVTPDKITKNILHIYAYCVADVMLKKKINSMISLDPPKHRGFVTRKSPDIYCERFYFALFIFFVLKLTMKLNII